MDGNFETLQSQERRGGASKTSSRMGPNSLQLWNTTSDTLRPSEMSKHPTYLPLGACLKRALYYVEPLCWNGPDDVFPYGLPLNHLVCTLP